MFKIGNGTLCFNAWTKSFYFFKTPVEGGLIDLYRKSEASGCSQTMESLEKGGFVLEDCKDEALELDSLVKSVDGDKSSFHLHVTPTLDCNFRCWYCYESHIENSIFSESLLNGVMRFISATIEGNPGLKRFSLSFFGGEPLLRFEETVKPLILYTAGECRVRSIEFDCGFTSNGSLLTTEIVDFLKNYTCFFQITLDGDRTDHDKVRFHKGGRGSYDDIVSNIKSLLGHDISVLLRINFTSSNIKGILDAVSSFADMSGIVPESLKIDLQRVWQDRGLKNDETEVEVSEIRKFLRSKNFKVLPSNIPTGVRNSCYGDKENHVLINWDGKLFGCTARDFSEDNSIGYLDTEGTARFNEVKLKKRRRAKLQHKACRTCRIAPLCGGGCSQRAMETADNGDCPLGYDEEYKDSIVLDLFDVQFCQ